MGRSRPGNAMRALVTGATPGGIGAAVACKLIDVALLDDVEPRLTLTATSHSDDLEAFADEQRARGARILIVAGDLESSDFPVEAARRAVEFGGGLDTVVSNAGNTRLGRLVDQTTVAEWDALMNVHVRAAWLLAATAYPALRMSRGSFIATTSTSGMNPHPGLGAYSPAKAALIMLIETLALEWGPVGIRANAVAPGSVLTKLGRKARPGMSDADLADLFAARAEITPLRALGDPDDIAEAIAFLASPAAKYITGQNLAVDGGLSLTANLRVPMRHELSVV